MGWDMLELSSTTAAWLFFTGLAIWIARGPWKIAAAFPLAVMGLALCAAGVVAWTGSDFGPMWVVIATPVCVALTVVVWVAIGVVWIVDKVTPEEKS